MLNDMPVPVGKQVVALMGLTLRRNGPGSSNKEPKQTPDHAEPELSLKTDDGIILAASFRHCRRAAKATVPFLVLGGKKGIITGIKIPGRHCVGKQIALPL